MLLASLALATEAPTPAEEEAWLVGLQSTLEDGRALLVATGLAHHAWAAPRTCDPASDGIAARSGFFLDAWRERVVQASSLADRLESVRDAPTLAPLRNVARSAAIQDAVDRARRQESAWRGSVLWHRENVAPYRKKCTPSMSVAPGWPDPSVTASDDPARLTAVFVLEPGWLCGTDGSLRVERGVALTDGEAVCFDASESCGCERSTVLPGAAVGTTAASDPEPEPAPTP
ncbi:MAG: hypothetical protein R3F61_13105 [Myxococcota bacterium]